jgi:hypothetical protein
MCRTLHRDTTAAMNSRVFKRSLTARSTVDLWSFCLTHFFIGKLNGVTAKDSQPKLLPPVLDTFFGVYCILEFLTLTYCTIGDEKVNSSTSVTSSEPTSFSYWLEICVCE